MALEVSSQKLAEVLLDFGLAPGNFPVRLGEPSELYSQLNTVALWALGRIPDDVEGDPTELTEAARLFVRRACFAPDNTHYQVMALTPNAFAPEELRSRYRSLIRLTHPDRGVPGLPNNAAGIVNRAHETLSDPTLRSHYDEHLAERATLAQAPMNDGPTVRRIELRHGLGDRWSSLRARYPKLFGMVLSVCGVSAAAIGLLMWAAHDAQEGRMLVIAGTEPESTADHALYGPNETAARRMAGTADERSPADRPTAGETPPRVAAASALNSMADPRSATNPSVPSVQGVERGPAAAANKGQTAAAAPQPQTVSPATAARPAIAAETRPVQPPAPMTPVAIAKVAPTPIQPAPAPRLAPPPPAAETAPPPVTAARAAAPPPPAGMIKTEQVSAQPPAGPRAPADAAPPPVEPPAPAPVMAAAAPAASPVRPSAPPAAPAFAPAPAPAEQRVAATTPTPTPTPAPAPEPAASPTPPPAAPAPAIAAAKTPATTPPQAVEAPPAARTAVVQTSKTWDVDAVRAKTYLIELVSKLSNPSAAKATNTYLAGLNVTGSLFRPALTLMDRYPEISVESMRWSDTEQPGILRVRGEIVLLARSAQHSRSVSYGLSAEFWGTKSGTVLANLNLRERE